jgi:hypothetical protein
MDPHAGRQVAIQQLGSRIDARRYWGVRPDELCAPGAASRQSRDHITGRIKEK